MCRKALAAVFFLITAINSYAFAQSPRIISGLAWLYSTQTMTGNWPKVTMTEYCSTVSALEAVYAIDSSNSAYNKGLQWLGAQVITPTELLSNQIIELSVAGKDVSNLLDILLLYHKPDGGFSGADGYPINGMIDTARALQAIKAADYSDVTILSQAIGFLTSNQNPDGGWGFLPTTTAEPGDPGNAYVTAIVLKTLNAYSSQFVVQNSIEKARVYLLTKQNFDGGFGSSSSTVYETSLAYMALAEVITDNTVLGNAVNYLVSNQAANGSWNDDPYSTALALQALHLAETRPTPPPAPTTGTVNGTVVDASTNQPLNNVTLLLASNPPLPAITDDTGAFSLANAPAGSYQISFSLNGYSTYSNTVSVTAGSIINIGTIPLIAEQTTGIIQGTATDASSGSPLVGVAITVTGTSTWSAATGPNGSFSIDGITPGNVAITASKTGYYDVTATGSVTAGGTLLFSPSLSTVPSVVTTGGVKGTITDAATSLPVQGALISILPDTAGMGSLISNASGAFLQNEMEPGTYSISITAQNYTSQYYTATILAGSTTDLRSIALAPKTTSNTIKGTVTNASTGQPVAGADVALTGTDTLVKTDASGSYIMSSLTLSDFVLRASADGLDSQIFHVSLNTYGTYTVNFALSSSQASSLTIASVSPDTEHYSAYSPVSLSVNIQNTGADLASGTIAVQVQNLQGEVVGYVQAVYTDGNGIEQNRFDLEPGSSISSTVPWDTGNLPPGTYVAVAKVMTGSGGLEGGINLAAESATSFVIDPTEAVAALDVYAAPKFANFGATEQMNILAMLSNRSNVQTELGLSYEWKSPDGITLHAGTSTITLLPEEGSKALTLETFPYTFTQSGDHQLFLTIQNGPIPTSLTAGMVSVAPQVRIEPSQTISPGTVVPDGDKRIRMQIRLKGVEQE